MLPEEAEEEAEQAIAREGAAYVSLRGARVFSDVSLTPESLLGRVTGIALATVYNDGDAEAQQRAALSVVFKTEAGLRTGFVLAADARTLDYEAALTEILGDAKVASGDPWPLPLAVFTEGDEEPEIDPEPAPYVTVRWEHDGELIDGTLVELKAEVFNLPKEKIAGYQWKNNIEGEFVDVPGAEGPVHTFFASEENTGCEWVVEVLLVQY
jgi:hypothetical protein